MKPFVRLLGILTLATAALHADETLDNELERCRELISAGKPQEANQIFERLLKGGKGDASLWTKIIRMQLDAGLLAQAAESSKGLATLAGNETLQQDHQALLDEILARHVNELDRILAMKSWADVREEEDDFSYRVASLLKTTAPRRLEKSATVVRHVFELLQQSPTEQRQRGPRNPDQPSSSFLIRLGEAPPLMATVLKIADDCKLTRQFEWSWSYVTQMTNGVMSENMNDIAQVFTLTPFAAEVGEFRDLCLPGTSSKSALGEVVSPLAYAPYRSDLQRQALRLLAGRQPRTFGVELIEVMLKGDNQQEIQAFLRRRHADLGKLKDEAASTLLSLLSVQMYAIESPAPLPDELAGLLKPLLDSEKEYLDSERAAWKSCQTLDDTGLNAVAARAQALRLLERLVARDGQQAGPFLDHAVELLRKSPSADAAGNLAELLRDVSGIPELVGPALRHAAREGISQSPGWLQDALSRGWNPGYHADQPQRLITFLESAGLLGDAQSFASQWGPGEKHAKGFVKRMKLTLDARKNAYEAFMPLLRDRQPRTFGTEMLQALITAGSDSSVACIVADRQQELSNLPADQQAEMAAFLSEWVWDLESLVKAAPAFAPVMLPLLEERKTAAQAELDRILTANALEEIRKELPNELNALLKGKGDRATLAFERVSANLAMMMKTRPDQAVQAFEKLGELIRQADKKRALPASWPFSQTSLGGWYLLCSTHIPLLDPIQKALVRDKTTLDVVWVEKSEERILPVTDFGTASHTVAVLENLQLLGQEVDYGSLKTLTSRPVVELVAQRFKAMPEPARRELATLLRTRPNKTFGTEFMLALLAGSKEEMTAILDRNAPSLARLDATNKKAALKGLRTAFTDLPAGKPGSAPVTGGLALLLSQEQENERGVLSALLEKSGPLPPTPTRGWLMAIADEVQRLLDRGARDEAGRFFDRALSRINQAPEGRPRSALFLGASVPRLIRVESFIDSSRTFNRLAFVLSRIQADATGQMISPPMVGGTTMPSLVEEVWHEKGGWARPGPAMAEVFEEMAPHLEGVPPACLAVMYYQFMKQVPAPVRKDLLAWAALQEQGAPSLPMVRELEAAVRRVELVAGEKADHRVLWKHYEALVNDGTVNPYVRLQVGSSLCRVHPDEVPGTVVLPLMRLAMGSWKKGVDVPAIDTPALLNAFSRMPATPEWREIAQEFAVEWEVRANGIRHERSRQIYMEVFQAIVATLSQLGDVPRMELFFEIYGFSPENWPAVLAAYGLPKQAAETVRRDWEKVATGLSRPTGRYALNVPLPAEPKVQALTAEFGPDEGELALLAEGFLLLGAKPRLPGRNAEQDQAWSRRMDDLVARVLKTRTSHAVLRAQLHALLAQGHPSALSQLAPLIKADAAALTAGQIGNFASDERQSWPMETLATAASLEVAEGNTTQVLQDLQRIMEALRLAAPRNDSVRAAARAVYVRRLLECQARTFATLARPQQEALLKVLGEELPQTEAIRVTYQGDEVVVKQVLRCLNEAFHPAPVSTASTPAAGATTPATDAALRATARAVDAFGPISSEREGMVRALLVALSGSEDNRLPEDVRVRLLLALLRQPSTRTSFENGFIGTSQFIQEVPILTKAEWIKHAPELTQEVGRRGRTAVDLAELAMDGGDVPSALACLELADREASAIAARSAAADPSRAGVAVAQISIEGVRLRVLPTAKDKLLLRKATLLIREQKLVEARVALDQVTAVPLKAEKANLMKLVDPTK